MAAGRVEQILIAGRAGELPHQVEKVRAVAGVGLEGDRYAAGVGTWSDWPVQSGKALTLVEAEVLEEIDLAAAEARRNVVTRGIRLNELVGHRFRIGGVECRGDRLCEPCRYLAELTGVPVSTLVGRGGLRVEILCDGEIKVADRLTLLP